MLSFPKPEPRRRQPRRIRRRATLGAKRKAVKAAGTLTDYEWERICEAYGNACAYPPPCGGRIQQHHIRAIARGGLHVASNVVPCCELANMEIGTALVEPMPGHPYR